MSVAASAGDGYSAGPRQRFGVPAARRRAPQLPRAALRPHPPAAPRRPDLPGAPPDVGNRRESSHVGHRWSAVATTRLCGPASARCSTKRQPVSREPVARPRRRCRRRRSPGARRTRPPSARRGWGGCGWGRSRSRRAAGVRRGSPRRGSGAGAAGSARATSSARGWPPARRRARAGSVAVHRVAGDDVDPVVEPGVGDPGLGDRGDDRQLDDGGAAVRGWAAHDGDRPRPGAAADVEQPAVSGEARTCAPAPRRARPARPRSRPTRSPAARRPGRRSPAGGPRPSDPARSCQAG